MIGIIHALVINVSTVNFIHKYTYIIYIYIKLKMYLFLLYSLIFSDYVLILKFCLAYKQKLVKKLSLNKQIKKFKKVMIKIPLKVIK